MPQRDPLRRNLWAVSATSFLTDLSSEMVLKLLPLFLSTTLGVRANVIGLIEGVAESTASLVKVASGRFSDRLRHRKWLAVGGYLVSAAAKPFFLGADTWSRVAGVRWAERLGKGIRTAPRDALLADSTRRKRRGLAFGVHRAADTAGAFLGLGIAMAVVWRFQGTSVELQEGIFRTLVLVSLVPAFLAVVVLAVATREVALEPAGRQETAAGIKGLGHRFAFFLLVVALFDLGNSSDAFLVLRASERGVSVVGVLGMLMVFTLAHTLSSAPGGWLSDRFGRQRVLLTGWLIYAAVYLGLGLAREQWQLWVLFATYGLYYGLSQGTAKALVADLVPSQLRGTAYGLFNATLGILDLPASVIAGVLWHGVANWQGIGPSAPFFFGAGMALLAVILLALGRRLLDPVDDSPHRP